MDLLQTIRDAVMRGVISLAIPGLLQLALRWWNRPQIINATVCVASLPGLSVRGFGEVVNPPASSV